MKQPCDLVAVLVDGGDDDVRRCLVIQLDDVLAQIGFQRLDAAFFQEMIEVHFLRHHRLALDDAGGVVALDNPQANLVGFRWSLRPMHLNPVLSAFPLQLFQQVRQLAQGPPPDGVAARAQLLERLRVGKQGPAPQP